jgi:hypothetical protein
LKSAGALVSKVWAEAAGERATARVAARADRRIFMPIPFGSGVAGTNRTPTGGSKHYDGVDEKMNAFGSIGTCTKTGLCHYMKRTYSIMIHFEQPEIAGTFPFFPFHSGVAV